MAKKKASTRKKGSRKTREVAPEHELPGGFWRQIVAVLMIALAVFLVLTWFGSGGKVLNDVDAGAFFVIGYGKFLLPILLVYMAVKIFRTPGNRLPVVVWIASILMVLWASGIMGIPTIGQENPTGGVIGEALNKVAVQILEPGVAVFLYIVLIFITALFILQVSPATVFKGLFAMLHSTKKEEDVENAKIVRAANKAAASGDLDIKVNSGVATVDSVAKMKVNAPKTAKAEPVVERALVSVSDPDWKMPSVDLLEKKQSPADPGNHQQNAFIIKSTLAEFGIDVEMEGANVGPRVTQYTMKPPAGVNLSKILARDKELALNLAVDKIRIEAPIPGTRSVGVEIPNVKPADVRLRGVLESKEWKEAEDPLTFAVGKDISGRSVVANLAKMPHLLIAGTTGSGKSVMTNTLISSLLYRNAPSDMKLIIVDPKQVEMVQYNDIPHLLTPIITSVDKALSAMKWAVNEMERRYSLMAEEKVKNIVDYNKKMAKKGTVTVADEDGNE